MYLRQSDRDGLKESVHDQHGGQVHHDVHLKVINARVVGDEANAEEEYCWDIIVTSVTEKCYRHTDKTKKYYEFQILTKVANKEFCHDENIQVTFHVSKTVN